ncbi:ABC transporter ATP-binding protein [Halobiforma nitratireducens]|uniref:Sulfate-transporting ATPase n=1 Tax=Halobiforma nitratireducens JCM 10879 TaxID=1227454 RepID=M0LQK5_9EURY|nr:ABC transporter ATP-binding protein [Halobiforma nitratireducens]EMA35378.1 sulfate-transporting ATPase [Halobiforma nitratireducens JCM 10879]
MTAIALQNVAKRYGDVRALHGIDLEIERGEVFGFLGPNGAGKSTTIDILLHYTHPTAGTVEVFDHDVTETPVAVRERVGILPEGFAPFETMTGREHLEYAIEANDADDDPDTLLERVGLDTEAAARPARGYSKGMAQRLALAMALVGKPDLLILDEPSTGLDPHGVRRMREIVREERDRGATVFFSSHILEQVEAVADRVAILRAGELVAVDTIDGLRATGDGGVDAELAVDLADSPTEELRTAVAGLEGVSDVTKRNGHLVVACRDDAKVAVLDEIRDAGGTVRTFSTDEASLEDLFVAYTGGSR